MILGPNHLHTSLKADFHQDIIQVFKQVQFPQANIQLGNQKSYSVLTEICHQISR